MSKKVVCLICIFILVLSVFTLHKLLSNKKIDISNSLVYIESIDEDTIKSGTGFVYKVKNNQAYILTNYHVIEQYNDIYVYNLNKQREEAKVVSYDIYKDIAVLTIDNVLNLKQLSFEDNTALNEGDKVYVVGNPSNMTNFGTITNGTIVGKADYLKELYGFNPIIVSAKTDFGSSGSPVLNEEGNVVGLIFLKNKDNDSSLFIPINDIEYILKGI